MFRDVYKSGYPVIIFVNTVIILYLWDIMDIYHLNGVTKLLLE